MPLLAYLAGLMTAFPAAFALLWVAARVGDMLPEVDGVSL